MMIRLYSPATAAMRKPAMHVPVAQSVFGQVMPRESALLRFGAQSDIKFKTRAELNERLKNLQVNLKRLQEKIDKQEFNENTVTAFMAVTAGAVVLLDTGTTGGLLGFLGGGLLAKSMQKLEYYLKGKDSAEHAKNLMLKQREVLQKSIEQVKTWVAEENATHQAFVSLRKRKDQAQKPVTLTQRLAQLAQQHPASKPPMPVDESDYKALVRAGRSQVGETRNTQAGWLSYLSTLPGFNDSYENYCKLYNGVDQFKEFKPIAEQGARQIWEAPKKAATAPEKAQAMLYLHQYRQASKELNSDETAKLHLQFYQDLEPELKAAALIGFTQDLMIRPDNYRQLLVESLMHPDERVKMAALIGLKNEPMVSAAVNIELERIQALEGGYSKQIRDFAESVMNYRAEHGLWSLVSPTDGARNIMARIVGNTHLMSELKTIVAQYKARMRDTENDTANVRIFLPGEPGIGKTSLVTSISDQLMGPGSLVKIDLRTVKTYAEFKKRLQAAEPLMGKVVLFDELHSLKIEAKIPAVEREAILDDLSSIVGGESIDLNFKDTIVAVITNEDLQKLGQHPSFSSAVAKRTLQRLMTCQSLLLEEDLKARTDDFVDKFEHQVFTEKEFEVVNSVMLRGGLKLDESAKVYFKKILADEYAEYPLPVAGRLLASAIMRPIVQVMNQSNLVFESGKHYSVSYDSQTKQLHVEMTQISEK